VHDGVQSDEVHDGVQSDDEIANKIIAQRGEQRGAIGYSFNLCDYLFDLVFDADRTV